MYTFLLKTWKRSQGKIISGGLSGLYTEVWYLEFVLFVQIDLQDIDGWTAIYIAAAFGSNNDIVALGPDMVRTPIKS